MAESSRKKTSFNLQFFTGLVHDASSSTVVLYLVVGKGAGAEVGAGGDASARLGVVVKW